MESVSTQIREDHPHSIKERDPSRNIGITGLSCGHEEIRNPLVRGKKQEVKSTN